MAKRRRGRPHQQKQTTQQIEAFLQFLAHCDSSATRSTLLRSASPAVIKSICNAALNVQQNPEITLSPSQRALLKKYRRKICTLANPKKTLAQKKRVLQNGRGFPVLGALLGIALPALGSLIFSRK